MQRHVTPAGFPVYFDPEPHVYYLEGPDFLEAIPSVTTVLGVLDKSGALVWWAWRNGIADAYGHLEAYWTNWHEERWGRDGSDVTWPGPEGLEQFIREKGVGPYTKRDEAGRRGNVVHDYFECRCKGLPLPPVPATEAGYIGGVEAFFKDAVPRVLDSEVVFAHKQHGYAGKSDLCAFVDGAELVVNINNGKREVFHGTGLWDLKTSSDVYESYLLQLDAYEKARLHSGYTHTDFQAVVRVTVDGKYVVVRNYAPEGSFLPILGAYKALEAVKDSKPNNRRKKLTLPLPEAT